MFKSAETLRLAAEMRALQRVASPWREARTTWFDGTPESIEARLAATERVLTFARSGSTPAHMELEREAATARAELKEASHRLMVDFLDDSARAFKGSKRVAGQPILDLSSNGGETGSSTSGRHRDDQKNNRYTLQHPEGYPGNARVVTNHDDTEIMSADGVHHWASQTAGRHDPDDFRPWKNTIADEPYFSMMPTPDFDEIPLDEDYEGRHRSEASRRTATVADFDDALLFDS